MLLQELLGLLESSSPKHIARRFLGWFETEADEHADEDGPQYVNGDFVIRYRDKKTGKVENAMDYVAKLAHDRMPSAKEAGAVAAAAKELLGNKVNESADYELIADEIIDSLKGLYPDAEVSDEEFKMLRSDAVRKLKDGWSRHDIIMYMKNYEGMIPDRDEATQLANMMAISKKYKKDVKEAIDRSKEESDKRQAFIDRIEGFFGDLQSIPYNQVSTADLRKIYNTLLDKRLIQPIKGAQFAKGYLDVSNDPPFVRRRDRVEEMLALREAKEKALTWKQAVKQLFMPEAVKLLHCSPSDLAYIPSPEADSSISETMEMRHHALMEFSMNATHGQVPDSDHKLSFTYFEADSMDEPEETGVEFKLIKSDVGDLVVFSQVDEHLGFDADLAEFLVKKTELQALVKAGRDQNDD